MLIARFIVILSLLLLNFQVNASLGSSRHLAITLDLTANHFDSAFITNTQNNNDNISHSQSLFYPGLDIKIGLAYAPNIGFSYFALSDENEPQNLNFTQANLLLYYDYNVLFSDFLVMLDWGLDLTKILSERLYPLTDSLYDVSIPQETPNLYLKATFNSSLAKLYYGFYLINNLKSVEEITNALSGLFIKYKFPHNINLELGYKVSDIELISVAKQTIESKTTYLKLSWNLLKGEANISDNYIHLYAGSKKQDKDNKNFIHPITSYPEFQQ